MVKLKSKFALTLCALVLSVGLIPTKTFAKEENQLDISQIQQKSYVEKVGKGIVPKDVTPIDVKDTSELDSYLKNLSNNNPIEEKNTDIGRESGNNIPMPRISYASGSKTGSPASGVSTTVFYTYYYSSAIKQNVFGSYTSSKTTAPGFGTEFITNSVSHQILDGRRTLAVTTTGNIRVWIIGGTFIDLKPKEYYIEFYRP